MGQKKPARANRLGVWVKREKDTEPRMVAEHESTWFSEFGNFKDHLEEDWKIRELIKNKYGEKAGISRIKINRKADEIDVEIYSARPANIFGRDNQKIEELKNRLLGEISSKIKIYVVEANLNDPKILAERIAYDLERRIAFRKACKNVISKAMASPEVIGIKVMVSGRLGGAEIARREWYLEGKVPLHTLHSNIDNGFARAITTYGIIGVQVVIHRHVNFNQKHNRKHNRSSRNK